MASFETLIGYEYNDAGYYRERVEITTAQELDRFMAQVVAKAFVERREIMITDTGDHAVFHVKAGEVLHAGGADPQAMTSLLAEWGQARHLASAQDRIARRCAEHEHLQPEQGYGRSY